MWIKVIRSKSKRLHKRIWQGKNTDWYWSKDKYDIKTMLYHCKNKGDLNG